MGTESTQDTIRGTIYDLIQLCYQVHNREIIDNC